MAVHRQHDPELDALLRKGAAEIARLNPHIGTPPTPYTDEEYAVIQRDAEELERLWDSPEGHRARQSGYTAADAVDEDRGE